MDYQALICLYISINEKISSLHSILLYIQKVKYYFTFTVLFCNFFQVISSRKALSLTKVLHYVL